VIYYSRYQGRGRRAQAFLVKGALSTLAIHVAPVAIAAAGSGADWFTHYGPMLLSVGGGAMDFYPDPAWVYADRDPGERIVCLTSGPRTLWIGSSADPHAAQWVVPALPVAEPPDGRPWPTWDQESDPDTTKRRAVKIKGAGGAQRTVNVGGTVDQEE